MHAYICMQTCKHACMHTYIHTHTHTRTHTQCLFVCTSNALDTIPGPLRDRMEVIQVSGYTADDKLQIARKHLLPTARADAGLKVTASAVSDAALRKLIVKYCREPGRRPHPP